MKAHNFEANHRATLQPSKSRERTQAFTLVELLTVLVVVAILAITAVPALSRTNTRSTRVQCMNNLRRFTSATLAYGGDNQGQLPQLIGGSMPWDMPVYVASIFIGTAGSNNVISNGYGLTRDIMYDPAVPPQYNDDLWNWVPNQYRRIGYALTFPSTPSVIATNQNPSIFPQVTVIAGVSIPPPLAAKRVLIADATLSLPGQNSTDVTSRASYKYFSIQTGLVNGQSTSHLKAGMPDGGNAGMLDGHVEWHQFQEMIPRTQGPTPVFWW
jgi:prepilin-type N-terminal cleavage/methylation domain-containing protein/prepilin-type processing-associated H-X9-DG protein